MTQKWQPSDADTVFEEMFLVEMVEMKKALQDIARFLFNIDDTLAALNSSLIRVTIDTDDDKAL